jgi:membrane dipeptidase
MRSHRLTLEDISERAWRVYENALVVDMHDDLPTRIVDDGYEADVRHGPGFTPRIEGHSDLPRLVESGITAEFMVAWADASFVHAEPGAAFARATRLLAATRDWVARHREHLVLASSGADVRRAKREGKVAIFLAVEGGHAIEQSLDRLRQLYALGARYLTLTWNNGNEWAGSSIGELGTRTGGLTDFGCEVVAEMNRLGMLVDVSHASDATVADVLAVSTAPVIASHSCARALNEHPRNLADDQLRGIARTGGVVNINFYSRFLDPRLAREKAAIEAAIEAERTAALAVPDVDRAAVSARFDIEQRRRFDALAPVPLSMLIDHIDHVARVAGIDHVGIGSDFNGIAALPEGLEDVTRLPRIAQGLIDRGYSDADVTKVLGGNLMRVLDAVLLSA